MSLLGIVTSLAKVLTSYWAGRRAGIERPSVQEWPWWREASSRSSLPVWAPLSNPNWSRFQPPMYSC